MSDQKMTPEDWRSLWVCLAWIAGFILFCALWQQ